MSFSKAHTFVVGIIHTYTHDFDGVANYKINPNVRESINIIYDSTNMHIYIYIVQIRYLRKLKYNMKHFHISNGHLSLN